MFTKTTAFSKISFADTPTFPVTAIPDVVITVVDEIQFSITS